MTKQELEFIKQCIEEDNVVRFYKSSKWRKKRKEVLTLDKHECLVCKDKGKRTKATIVHHVLRLRNHPELALSIYHNNQRQLISICHDCHEKEHVEERKHFEKKELMFTNEEKW